MDAIESIMKRTSIRAYRSEQITDEVLQMILQAGMAAPVGSNAYDTLHMTVVQNHDLFPVIDKAASDMIFNMLGKRMDKAFGAPTMVFVSSKPTMMPGTEYANAACVLENMAIAATSLGVASIIWGGAAAAVAQSEPLRKELEIPDGYRPLLCISLGYAQEEESAKKHEIGINTVL